MCLTHRNLTRQLNTNRRKPGANTHNTTCTEYKMFYVGEKHSTNCAKISSSF